MSDKPPAVVAVEASKYYRGSLRRGAIQTLILGLYLDYSFSGMHILTNYGTCDSKQFNTRPENILYEWQYGFRSYEII